MQALYRIILAVLFPLRPVRQLWERTRQHLFTLLDIAGRPELLEELSTVSCTHLEGAIAHAEDAIQRLIGYRAAEILGLPYDPTRWVGACHPPHCARPFHEVLDRLEHCILLFHQIERLARIRAARLRREIVATPLRLDAPHRSTSPALCAVEATHRCLASTTPQEWGRWQARPCAHDGGGRASARGPPRAQSPESSPHHL